MDDMPLHEASVGLWRHWGDARFAPPTIYFLNIGHANQLFSVLVYLLSFVVPITWASKITVAASLLCIPVSAARFADHVGAPRWTALLVAPLGLGWLFFWGLIQNIIGLVVLLLCLPAIDTFAARPTWRGAAGVSGAFFLFHFAHEAMQLVGLVALVICSVGLPLRRRDLGIRAVPVAFCMLVVVAAHVYAWSVAGQRQLRTPPYLLYSLDHKLTTIPGVLYGGLEPYVRNLMMLLALVPIAMLVASRARLAVETSGSRWARLHRWRFELLGGLLLVLYFAAPATIKSTTLVYHRFLPPAWAVLVIQAGAGLRNLAGRELRLLPALCAVPPIATLCVAWPTFADCDRVYTELEPLIDKIEIGSAFCVLNIGPDLRYRLFSPNGANGHIVALRGGRSLFDFTQSPISPVAQRPEKEWTTAVDRLSKDPYMIRPGFDFTRYRYILIATTQPGLGAAVEMVFQDSARLVASSGSWYLFESTLPRVAVDVGDDNRLPRPLPGTLLGGLKRVAKKLEAEGVVEPAAEEADAP
jgi:hypothetical protein